MTTPALNRQDVNTSALFVSYLKGATHDEIANEFGVSKDYVTRISREQRWRTLVKHAEDTPALNYADETALRRIDQNREANLKQAERLRDEVDRTLRDVTADGRMPLAPSVLKEVSQAVSTIHDLTYRAVGDKDKQRDAGQGRATEMPKIVINMPTAIATPRQGRAIPM